jgi:hypothetical protein
MLKRFVAVMGIVVAGAAHGGPAVRGGPPASGSFQPYANQAFNTIYNLLFCDNLELFRSTGNKTSEGAWTTLLAKNPDVKGLRAIAEDPHQESRIRLLAYRRLAAIGESVPPKLLLGVIVEVHLDNGLDTIAAFEDGRIRYINAAEKMAVFEPSPADMRSKLDELLSAARSVIRKIGPWDKERLSPPGKGDIRITFLASDGLYFGQGRFAEMQNEPMARPVIAAALVLVESITHAVASQGRPPSPGR